jgi:crotonobetainyl-CoA:carnitine CoA-transferase CaiB-like acyl-CoA transferase
MAERVFRAIGRPEMIDDPRSRTNTDRVRHIDECDGAVAAFIAERTLDEAMAVFSAAEVTATPVYEIDQLVADKHIQARGVIVKAPDSEAGSVLMHNVIPRLSETPGKLRRPAPALGEHTRELLKAVGYSDARIASLIKEGVAKQA